MVELLRVFTDKVLQSIRNRRRPHLATNKGNLEADRSRFGRVLVDRGSRSYTPGRQSLANGLDGFKWTMGLWQAAGSCRNRPMAT